ncbi:Signal recognition particle subunit SRP72 [Choanephora cucurbitarum]|uniref:Signal recognition particle subunit SRP72 n=1 Tax=Choanephora cucurbitarum TaxID=101091 RepID=A0A1C7NCH7_9FUNG|nr:Signal recognition particle subunit SRP72 [Choanephora cucurbitarum]
MSTNKEQQAATLFTELKQAIDNYDEELSLDICDKLIKLDPNDQLALQCKVVTLIRLEKYKDALTMIARQFRNSDIDMSYEKIYCYYRTNQLVPAMELLQEVKSKHQAVDPSLSYLEAQLLYSQGQFEKAIKVYESLLKSSDKNNHLYDEIQVNLLAAKAGLLYSSDQQATQETDDLKESADLYEVAYNAASVYLARGDIKKAQQQLELAHKQCSDRSQGMSKEEHEQELAVIATQLGYTYQLQGRSTDAMNIYKQLLTSSDLTVAAVVSNNVVAIEQASDLEDAAKKLKVATSKEADAKLKQYQKRVISMNESLLQLYSHKYSACRDQAQKLIDKYPDNDLLYLILASATYHQHKATKAIEELKKFSEKNPGSLAIRFATIQLQLLESQPAQALATLESYLAAVKQDKHAYYKPALIALLVWLYEQVGQSDKAMAALDEASSVWKNDSAFASSVSAPKSTVKQTAAFKLKTGKYQEAVVDYEQLVKSDPSDAQAIAGLIAAYAEVDPRKAEQYGNALPAIAVDHLDIETLEKIVPGVKRGYVKKDPNGVHIKKPKTKKKRAALLPKKMDPNTQPDPERWLPKYERSTFRMKGKSKKALNKGPQGVMMEGGGIGGTGSANIGGKKAPTTPTTAATVAAESTEETPKPISTSKSTTNKKKKGKGKGKK